MLEQQHREHSCLPTERRRRVHLIKAEEVVDASNRVTYECPKNSTMTDCVARDGPVPVEFKGPGPG